MAVREPSTENRAAGAPDGATVQIKNLEQTPGGQERARVSGVSLHVSGGELVVITGPGKSALLEMISGLRPPDGGQILINGVDLYNNLRVLSGYIGYVPPENALHDRLTAREALDFQARLRLSDASGAYAAVCVDDVLKLTGLQGAASAPLGELSSLEKRLLSIGIEMLSPPGLLLVNEPGQALSPAEAAQVTRLLRRLADRGLTVLQASDVPRCAALADKFAVLSPDGTLAWFGPAPEAMEYFRELHPDAASLNSSFNLENALEVPDLMEAAGGESLGKVFMDQPYYQKYVSGPISGKRSDLELEDRPLTRFRGAQAEGQPPPQRSQPPALKKTAALVGRNFRAARRSRRFIFILLAPILLALTDMLFTSPGMNDPTFGDPRGQPAALGAMLLMNMLTAALVFQNEISGERAIFRREQRALRLAFPYALSKVLWLSTFAVYAGSVWALVHFAASNFDGGPSVLGGYAVTFILVAFIGGGLGIIASSLGRSALGVSTLVLLFILPQFLLSGSVIPLANLTWVVRPLAWANPARYAFDILLTLSDYGTDVVADACWQMPKEQRVLLSDTQKQGCRCMGESIFSNCAFPGIYRSFNYVIEQARPVQPEIDSLLVLLPDEPQPQEGQSLAEYQQAVANYTQQLRSYLADEETFIRSLRDYTAALEEWQRLRSLAIGSAEASIADAIDHYGHAFQVPLVSYWFILSGISLILTVFMLVLIPR